ncbi:MAG TPA: alpha/beta fold hydrolase [Burkholderiales bacterium]|nr:alpha/beta fold hydrolase [Burkholderiales bacterium]
MPFARLLLCLSLLAAGTAVAQIAPTRTWPELKEAVQDRVNRNAYPLTGYDKEEVREVLARINSLDRDEWARSWMQQGDKHLARAKAAQGAGERAKAREAYLDAWRYYGFGAWPTQNSDGKREAHRRATAAFRDYAALAEPAIEVLRVPYEGKEITAYLQLPQGVRPAPVVMSVGGLDSYKEYVVEQYGPGYLAARLGYLAIDMPGTGEAPIKIDLGAERMFSRLLDALATRKEVDPKRIGFMGVSWGGHWAARVAFTEKDRLRASVDWAGPADMYFSREWQSKALSTREYLFDLFAARAGVYGVSTLEEFYAYGPRMSLKNGDWLTRPSAPMLLVNGEKDTQVPIDDLYILLRNGAPKEAWVNPQGGHIGRGPGWPDTRIFKEVVVPWLALKLGGAAPAP